VAASVNVMSVKVPPTSIASVQVLGTGPAILDRPAVPGKMPGPCQAWRRLLHFP
jgi:hypothetical protein